MKKQKRLYRKTVSLLLMLALLFLSSCGSHTADDKASNKNITASITTEVAVNSNGVKPNRPRPQSTETESRTSSKMGAGVLSSSTPSSSSDKNTASKGTSSRRPAAASFAPTRSTITSSEQAQTSPQPAQKLLANMSLEEKIAQLFMVAPEMLLNASWDVGTYSGEPFLYPVGGLIFFEGNIKTPTQTTKFIKDLQNASDIPMFIAVDVVTGPRTVVAAIAFAKRVEKALDEYCQALPKKGF